MAKIGDGTVIIKLGEVEHRFIPSLDVMLTLSRQFQGLEPLRRAVMNLNIDAIVFVIRIGVGLPETDTRAIQEAVYDGGLDAPLFDPIGKFLDILQNGGRPIETGPAAPGEAAGA